MPPRSVERLGRLLGPDRAARLQEAAEGARRALGGRRLWHVSSTATGGGVAEMLHLLVGYADEAQVDTRWVVIDADAQFFAVTKRLHNRLHGTSGDVGALGRDEDSHYSSTLEANAAALGRIRPGDIVILHVPRPPVWPALWCVRAHASPGEATSAPTCPTHIPRRPGISCCRTWAHVTPSSSPVRRSCRRSCHRLTSGSSSPPLTRFHQRIARCLVTGSRISWPAWVWSPESWPCRETWSWEVQGRSDLGVEP